MSMINENMYSVQDFEDSRFYQLPKQLFGNENYKGLSLASKTVYSILRDRQDLSIKNNWVDENGKIFFYFDGEKLSDILEVHVNTVIKYKKELVKYKLLHQVRQGLGKPNKLYVMKPIKSQNHKKVDSGITENGVQESQKSYTNDTEYSDTENINIKGYVENHSIRISFDLIIMDIVINHNKTNLTPYRMEKRLEHFFRTYKFCTGYHTHFKINKETCEWIAQRLDDLETFYEEYEYKKDIGVESIYYFYQDLLEEYFKTPTKNGYYSLQNFLHENKIKYLMMKLGWIEKDDVFDADGVM